VRSWTHVENVMFKETPRAMIQMRDAISKGKKIIDGEIGVMKMRKLGKKVEEKPEIKKIRV
jgi:hypothetical protein